MKISVDSLDCLGETWSHDHRHQVTFFEVHNVTMYINVYQNVYQCIEASSYSHMFTKLMGRCQGCYSTDGTKRYDLIASWQKPGATNLQLRSST